jgi:hypothetical protein
MKKKKISDLKLPNFKARLHSPKVISTEDYLSFVDEWLSQIDPENITRSRNFISPSNTRFEIL